MSAFLNSPGLVLRDALALRGISEANGWTIFDTFWLSSDFTLLSYQTFVDTRPGITVGTLGTWDPTDITDSCGAVTALSYTRGMWDAPSVTARSTSCGKAGPLEVKCCRR